MSFITKVSDAVKTYQGTLTSVALTTIDTIERSNFNSLLVELNVGSVFGAPSAFTATTKVTHCATPNGSYTDYTSDRSGAALMTLTTASTGGSMEVDLGDALAYIKLVTATAFTGGSSPYTNTSVVVTLGGSHYAPPL